MLTPKQLIDRLESRFNDEPALIVAKDHAIIKYEVNGRKRYIVDRIRKSNGYDKAVYLLKSRNNLGNDWATVYNFMDQNGLFLEPPIYSSMEKAVDRVTI